MNINPYILITAFILSLVVYAISKRYQWEKKIAYHACIAIIGVCGLAFFTFMLTQHYNTTYLLINSLLFIGIVLKVLKIILLRKGKE